MITTELHAYVNSPQLQCSPSDEWRFVYEWFSGWRWERYRNGIFATESLENFETREDCLADANRNGRSYRRRARADAAAA